MNTVTQGKFYDTDAPYVRCQGSNYEIGVSHGQTSANQIAKCIAVYQDLYYSSAGITWDQARAKANTFLPYLQSDCPDLIEEIKGISVGSGQPFDDILTLNIRSEICLTNYSDGCTSISHMNKETGEIYIGQNWDWVPEIKDSMIILDVKPTGKPRMLMCAEAGIIAKYGFNSCGLGAMLNAIKCSQAAMKLPVHFALRRVLESSSVDDACKMLESQGIASSANLLMSDSSRQVTCEVTPLGVSYIEADDGLVLHTNHLYAEKKLVEDNPAENSFFRLNRMREISQGVLASFDSVRSRLADELQEPYGICRGTDPNAVGIENMVTLATLIFSTKSRQGEISFGRPCNNPKRYRLFFD